MDLYSKKGINKLTAKPGDLMKAYKKAPKEGSKAEEEAEDQETEKSERKKKTKKMKPKGKKGMAQVKKLGRTYKTGGFAKIASKAAKEYGSKEKGKKVAGAVFQRMVKARKNA